MTKPLTDFMVSSGNARELTPAEKDIFLGQSKTAMDIRATPDCPVCASRYTLFVQKVKGNRTGKMIAQFHCIECRSFFNPSGYAEDDDQMKADATYVLTQRDKIAGHARQLALELIVKLPHAKSMLEVGCGAGFFVEACKDYGFRGVGFDINPHLTEFAQTYKMIDVINGPLTEDFPGKFDLVAAIGVLEHVEKPRDLFKLMVSKLERDGAIYINVPFVEREHWPFLWRANDNPGSTPADVFYDNDVHITHFSREGLERMGRDFGARSAEFFICKDVVDNSPGSYPGILFRF